MNKVNFAISLLFFWVKGEVEVDNRFVKTKISNTILGFIPAGKDQQNIPLKNISGAMLSTKFFIKPFIIGLILLFLGLGTLSDSFILGLILLILGVGIAGSGIQTILNIEKAGTPYLISVPFFEKPKMQVLNDSIHSALVDDSDKTDLNFFFDKKTQ
ncbi:hypothetical protein [Virgibacillus halodenitrificans]|uniref:hypothetical protein n=1 Tax=Virgibacillus halodenitrificans TaxID=1482 RepID=UPI000EF4E058|nr:hypothetical protein [Virgibacillus halodenitrificans]MCG1027018.1 hypothetical protein [Virgibacillus halodenitrificans]